MEPDFDMYGAGYLHVSSRCDCGAITVIYTGADRNVFIICSGFTETICPQPL